MKVFKLTLTDLQVLHDQTDCSFFKSGDDEKVMPTILKQGEFYIYGVDKFTKKYPDIDVSGLTQITFVQIDDGI